MRQVLLQSLITIMLLIGFVAVAGPYLHTPKQYPETVHKTLYLDRYMGEWETEEVIAAALEWHEASGGLVTFDVKMLPDSNINPTDAIIIIDVTPDYPEIILIDHINGNSTLGYFNSDSGMGFIALVNARISADDYRGVVLHELGHALGLEHNKDMDGIGTLMYPTIDYGATYITPTDVANFCKLYHCDPKKLHH